MGLHLVATIPVLIWVADVHFQPSGHIFPDGYHAFTGQGGLDCIIQIKAFVIFKALQKYKVLALRYSYDIASKCTVANSKLKKILLVYLENVRLCNILKNEIFPQEFPRLPFSIVLPHNPACYKNCKKHKNGIVKL